MERLNEQRDAEAGRESETQEVVKKLQRQLRELQEKYGELEKKAIEVEHRKNSLVSGLSLSV